jgi:hypothetical protein
MSIKVDQSGVSSKEKQCMLFRSQPSSDVLINAINKYEQAIKKYVDPSISKEEAVLLIADMVEKLTDSLPKHLQEYQGNKRRMIDKIEQIKKQKFSIQDFIKKPVGKLTYAITSVSQRLFTRQVL